MIFEYNGKLHRMAYRWNPHWHEKELPRKANVCPLFWRLMFALFVAWPFIWLTRAFGWVVRIVGFVPMLLLFGYKPTGPGWRLRTVTGVDLPIPFVPIERWPKVNGFHLYPGTILFYTASLGSVAYVLIWEFMVGVVVQRLILSTVGLWVIGTIASVFALFVIVSAIVNTDLWPLTKEFVRAKKQRVCPEVEFK